MKKFLIVAALALSSAAIQAKDIVDTAVAAGNFKTLTTALTAAGLIDTLKGKGPFTVIAPTDEAFAKVPKADLAALLADKAEVCIEILESDKRPVAAVADHFEFKSVQRVDIAMDHDTELVLLHDPGHSLDERILTEQFGY